MDTVSIFGWIAADLCPVHRVVATRIASAGAAVRLPLHPELLITGAFS